MGKTSFYELIKELRFKYLTILKSIYWNSFEEGSMHKRTIILLMDSVDQSIDKVDEEI